MLKRIVLIFVIATYTILANAQSPESLSYQAIIRDNNSALVTNQKIGVRLTILQGANADTPVYTETQSVSSNKNGLISLVIGDSSVSDNISDINWAAGPFFIKTEIDINNGSSYTELGTTQLLSVPYALHSKTSDDFSSSVAASITSTDITKWNSTAGGSSPEIDAKLLELENIMIDGGYYTIRDVDYNVYKTVRIGDQVWMKENLKSSKLNTGDTIMKALDAKVWAADTGLYTTPMYCWYGYDSATYENVYGKLYNWATINTGKLCPEGWHVPSQDDWLELSRFVSNDFIAGVQLKEADFEHWKEFPSAHADSIATNSSGFTALPGGGRIKNGSYINVENAGYWWSSSEFDASTAWRRKLYYEKPLFHDYPDNKNQGYSVRCIRDE